MLLETLISRKNRIGKKSIKPSWLKSGLDLQLPVNLSHLLKSLQIILCFQMWKYLFPWNQDFFPVAFPPPAFIYFLFHAPPKTHARFFLLERHVSLSLWQILGFVLDARPKQKKKTKKNKPMQEKILFTLWAKFHVILPRKDPLLKFCSIM